MGWVIFLYRISKSLVGTFNFCPYKAKLWLNKVPPTDPKPHAMQRGSLIHDVFERFYKKLETTKIREACQTGGKRSVKEYFTSVVGDVQPASLDDASHDLKLFIDWNVKRWQKNADEFMPLHVEEKIYLEDEDIVGVIDRVDVEDGKLRIIDYKSGYLGTKDISKFRFELSLYAHIFERRYNKVPDIWGIYFSGEGKLIQEPVNPQYWNRWGVKKINKLRHAIETDNFPRTEWVSGCQNCEYFTHCWR